MTVHKVCREYRIEDADIRRRNPATPLLGGTYTEMHRGEAPQTDHTTGPVSRVTTPVMDGVLCSLWRF